MNQEPGTNLEIKLFAQNVYQAQFPLMAKSDVNGENTNPIYRQLRRNSSLFDAKKNKTKQVPWNFSKFLVDAQCQITFISPRDEAKDYEPKIIEALKKEACIM